MFESPRYVIKAGRVLVEDGELRDSIAGEKFCAALEPDEQGEKLTADWFDRHGSYDVRQLGLLEAQRQSLRRVALQS
jgi:formylmethanofuran dehydrogenase subunit A